MAWHRHQWKVVGNTFSPPVHYETLKGGVDFVQAVLHGVTTLTQQCTVCGRVTTTEHLGRVQLDLITKDEAKKILHEVIEEMGLS